MSATLIRTQIDRLFGDMTRDNRTALLDMRAIARQATEYADLLDDEFEDGDFEDFDDDFDDFEDEDDDFEDDDDFDDDYEDEDDDYFDDDEYDDGFDLDSI